MSELEHSMSLKIFETFLTLFIVGVCGFVSQTLLTAFQLEVRKSEDSKKLILNILYSHLAMSFQLSSIVCTVDILAQITFNVTDTHYLHTMDIIFQQSYLVGASFFLVIGIFRVIKQLDRERYLDIR